MAGKMDWAAYGLPIKKNDEVPWVIDRLRRQVARCDSQDSVATAKQRLAGTRTNLCAVINEENILLGACEAKSLETDPSTPVERIMESGPKTLRPNYPVEAAAKLLRKSGKSAILVTSSDGKLLGLFTDSD